jgi:hypothetical protein
MKKLLIGALLLGMGSVAVAQKTPPDKAGGAATPSGASAKPKKEKPPRPEVKPSKENKSEAGKD